MNSVRPDDGFLLRFCLLLIGLSLPLWVLGARYDVQLFPGFNLYQLPLGMPAVAALVLVAREEGATGLKALVKRAVDFGRITPLRWLVPILLMYPSIGLVNYGFLRLTGTEIPMPKVSAAALLGYGMVFFMTYGEELGLTGYLTDRLQSRYSALVSGLVVGVIWAAYHVPGFVISGYYAADWIVWHAIYTVTARVLFVWIYNNSGKSLFSMALLHATAGIFWVLWPATGNLQQASPYYDPRIAALTALVYLGVVLLIWGPKTLARFRFAPPAAPR